MVQLPTAVMSHDLTLLGPVDPMFPNVVCTQTSLRSACMFRVLCIAIRQYNAQAPNCLHIMG